MSYDKSRGRRLSVYEGRLSTGTVGALHELKVAADLIERGFHVFRALSPSCECDLAFIENRRLFRVEVTTGYRNVQSGKLIFPPHSPDRYDVLAIVIEGKQIIYQPELTPLGQAQPSS